MSNYKLIFATTTTQGITFAESTVATDGGLTVVLQTGERVFAVPSASIVAIERLPEPKAAPAEDAS